MMIDDEPDAPSSPPSDAPPSQDDRALFETLTSKEPEAITQDDLNAILAAANLTVEDIASLDALAQAEADITPEDPAQITEELPPPEPETSEPETSEPVDEEALPPSPPFDDPFETLDTMDVLSSDVLSSANEEQTPQAEEKTLEEIQEEALRSEEQSQVSEEVAQEPQAPTTNEEEPEPSSPSPSPDLQPEEPLPEPPPPEKSAAPSFIGRILGVLPSLGRKKAEKGEEEPTAAVLTFDFTSAQAPISKKQKKEEEDAAAALSMAKAEEFIQGRDLEKKEIQRFKNPVVWLAGFLGIALALSGIGWYWIIYKKHSLLAEQLDEGAALEQTDAPEDIIHYRWIGEKIMYPLFTSTAPGAQIIPRIFLIVYDVGVNEDLTDAAYDSLPLESILAFSPYARERAQQIDQAHAEGFETVTMIPLETAENVDFGRLTVFSGPSITQALDELLAQDPPHVILLGGDVFLASAQDTQKLVARLKGKKIIAPPDCLMTQWHAVARQKKVHYWPVTHMVYAHQLETLDDILEDAKKMAEQIGRAIIAVPLRKSVLDRINDWIYHENMSIIGLSPINLL